MDKMKAVLKNSFFSFWFFSIFVVVLGISAAVIQYRSSFSGGLATESIEFANFGAYIGGIFGPLVSFLTLLAVLKTVYLQRDLLDTQKEEFRSLMALQGEAALKQDQQITLAKVESERARVESYQTTILNVIESFGDQFRREADGMADTIHKIIGTGIDARNMKNIDLLMEKKKFKEEKIQDLLLLAFEVSVKDFESIKDIRAVFGPRIREIVVNEN